MQLPSLCSLSINERSVDVGASWAWDEGKYTVSFSIDIAVGEQIDGLGKIEADQFVPEQNPPISQLRPIAVLKVVREHAIQRLWDINCAVPRLDFPPKPRQGASNPEEPWPDDPDSFINTVASWVVKVNATLSKEQARRRSTAEAQAEESRAARRRRRDEEDEDEEMKEEEEEEGEQTVMSASAVEVNIREALSRAQKEQGDSELKVLRALLEVEKMFDTVQRDAFNSDREARLSRDRTVSEFLVRNKDMLTSPGIGSVRLSPKPNWYDPTLTRSSKLIRWWKMSLVLGEADDEDEIDGAPFEPSALVPSKLLDGSFYSGDTLRDSIDDATKRVAALTTEHIIPISHMRNCKLIRECRNPTHLAMITTMATRDENSGRSNLYLPLGATDRRMNDIQSSGKGIVFTSITADQFRLERRQNAARMLGAGYLTLPMLERSPDPNTELGAREGGVYDRYREDIWDLMTGTANLGVRPDAMYTPAERLAAAGPRFKRAQFRQAWMWEAGLSLLQWFYLQQPYNPLPMMMYRRKLGLEANDMPLRFWKDLLFMRLRNSDMTSEMLRREMQEEVANAPLGDGLPGPDELSRQDFIDSLNTKIQAMEAKQRAEQEAERRAQQTRQERRRGAGPSGLGPDTSRRRRDSQPPERRSSRLAGEGPPDPEEMSR